MKQIYLSATVFLLCVVGIIFLKLGINNPWLLLVPAFLIPVSLALVSIFIQKLWVYGALALLVSVAHVLILGIEPITILCALLWFCVIVSLPPMVQKDLSTRLKLNIIEVARRPVKWVLFLIAVSYAVLCFYRFSSSDVVSKMAVAPKFELQVIELSYPEVNASTTVNQFVNIVTGNDTDKTVDAATRQEVLSKLGVDGTYSGSEKIANENELLYSFVGGRLQEALGRFDEIVPLLMALLVWQGLVLISYIILALLLAIVFEIFLVLIKYKFAEVVSYEARKEEIRL